MKTGRASKTAQAAAAIRAYDNLSNQPPLFHDAYAIKMTSPAWRFILSNKALMRLLKTQPVRRAWDLLVTQVALRSAYSEDWLNNATALNQLGKEAKNTGNVLSESMVNDALEAQKAMNAVKAEITGLTNQMVANAAPAITFFAQNFDVLAQAGMIAASVYTARLMPSVVGYVKTLATELLAKGQAIYQSKVRATAALAEANAVQVKAAAELRSAQAAVAVASAGSTQAVAQTRLTAARAADTAATLAQSRYCSTSDDRKRPN